MNTRPVPILHRAKLTGNVGGAGCDDGPHLSGQNMKTTPPLSQREEVIAADLPDSLRCHLEAPLGVPGAVKEGRHG